MKVREYKRRLRLILRSKLNGKNKIRAKNSWAVAIMRYGAGVLEWRFDELKELERLGNSSQCVKDSTQKVM